MSLKLYEIASEYRELMSILENSADEEVDKDTFLLAIGVLETDFTAKSTNIACLIRELSSEAQAIAETAYTMNKRCQRLERRSDWLRDYLRNQMQTAGIVSARDARISITLKKNPASVQIESPESLPMTYCRVIPQRIEPDKTAIKAALKSGTEIPGCALVQTTRLDIQ